MENDELTVPKIRSRRNSLQSLDRHKNVLGYQGSTYINAGIDSTWFVRNFPFQLIISFSSGIKPIEPFNNSNDTSQSNFQENK